MQASITGAVVASDPTDAAAEEDSFAPGDEESETRSFTLPASLDGERLDRALAVLLPELSRSYLQQLIEQTAVHCDGELALKPARRMRVGACVTIEVRPTLQSQAFRPEPMELEVVFEDEHVLVIDKPAGLVVHPAPGNWSGTLLNGLLARDAGAAHLPRAGIVHRLDKDTSGLMVIARTRSAMDQLVRQIAERDVARQYLALADHPWTSAASRDVDAPIGRDPRNRLRMAVVDLARNPGKLARTTIHHIASTGEVAWVRCALHTGRTHQIRVHMASIGHPLLGDVLYGGPANAGMQRQALHAFRLAFAHPVSKVVLDLVREPPLDMREAVAARGLPYNEKALTKALR